MNAISLIRRSHAGPRTSTLGNYGSILLIGLPVGTLLLSFGGFSDAGWWRLVLVLAIAPLAEEVIFRLGLHEALLRRDVSPWQANLVVAAAFGLAHWVVRGDPMAMLVVGPAVVLGLAYTRRRNLAPCVWLHSGMNLIWLYWH